MGFELMLPALQVCTVDRFAKVSLFLLGQALDVQRSRQVQRQ
jgi:hypothetical protein